MKLYYNDKGEVIGYGDCPTRALGQKKFKKEKNEVKKYEKVKAIKDKIKEEKQIEREAIEKIKTDIKKQRGLIK